MTTPEAEKPETAEATPAAVFVRPEIMTKRADFLAAAQGRRMALSGFHLQARFRDDGIAAVRVGFTCSKKVGNAVARNRELMGATNPANAAPGTIRKLFAESIEANSVHGSDSPENAAIEIAYFFAGSEIVG